MIAIDNTTVMYKQGHMVLLTTSTTVDLFLWQHSQDIVLWARHIPGCLNVIADHLSRPFQSINIKWSLHPEIAALTFEFWGIPQRRHVRHRPQFSVASAHVSSSEPRALGWTLYRNLGREPLSAARSF